MAIEKTKLDSKYEQYKDWKCHNNILQDLNSECGNMTDYCGRVIYELLQNADDATSTKVQIEWDKGERTIKVKNDGDNPFSEKGFTAIIYSSMSTKQQDPDTTGSKGIGFRSVLNWAENLHIYSNGIHLNFNEDITCQKWKEIIQSWESYTSISSEEKKNFINDCEQTAKFHNRKCPLPIMSVPSITVDDRNDSWTTVIEIKCKEEALKQIEEQINNLNERILVFLRHIEEIEITGIKTLKSNLHSTAFSEIEDGLTFHNFILNNVRWHKISKDGMAMAYSLEEEIDIRTNYLYTYFPTLVQVGLPCLIQAEFDLLQSREGLQRNERNQKVQEELSNFLLQAAEKIAQKKMFGDDYWFPYKLVFPDTNIIGNVQITELLENLRMNAKGRIIYPNINKEFKIWVETLFYSNQLAEFIQNNNLSECFPEHLYPHEKPIEPHYFSDRNDLDNRIRKITSVIKSDKAKLKDFISIWYDIATSTKLQLKGLPILVDENDEIIDGPLFIKIGDFNNVYFPNNVQPRWLNNELQEKLRDLTQNTPDPNGVWQRSLHLCLNQSFCNEVKYYDKSTVLVEIAPTNQGLEKEEIIERIQCLYRSWDTLKDSETDLSDIYLLNEEENSCNIKELVDCQNSAVSNLYQDISIIPRKYKLLEYEKWGLSQLNGSKTSESLTEEVFFEKLMGKCKFVPRKTDTKDQYRKYIEKQRPSDYGVYIREDKSRPFSKNMRYYVPSDFLNALEFEQSIACLMKDMVMMKEIQNPKPLKYFYNGEGETPVKQSYMSFKIENDENKYKLGKIKTYIIEENLFISDFSNLSLDLLEKTHNIDPNDLRQFLICLCAKPKLTDLTAESLHRTIENMRVLNPKKVQNWYKKLKEAIKKTDPNYVYNGPDYYLLAKKNGIKDWFLNTQVFYNNNQCLPSKLQETYPILDMPLRAGEKDIANIFKVNLTSLIDFSLCNEKNRKNEDLSLSFKQYIQDRILDILLFLNKAVLKNDTLRTYSTSLRNLEIEFYTQCSCVNNESKSAIELKHGEYVFADKKYCIMSNAKTIYEIVDDYAIITSVSEAICMTLKLSSDEVFEKILTLLRNDNSWNTQTRNKEYDQEDIEKLTTLIEGDITEICNDSTDIDTRIKQRESEKRERIAEKNGYFLKVCKWLYKKVETLPDLHKSYTDYTHKLDNDDWEGEDYLSFVKKTLKGYIEVEEKETFNLETDFEISIRPEYKKLQNNIDEDRLPSNLKSMLLFMDHEKELNDYIQEERSKEEKRDDRITKLDVSKISSGNYKFEPVSFKNEGARSQRNMRSPKISNKEMKQLGDLAEKVVIEYLKNIMKCHYAKLVSESSNILSGSDNKHYDIEYQEKEDDEKRHLEVKWFDSNKGKFHLSRAEYNHGKTHSNIYDIALVMSKGEDNYEVVILRTPLKHGAETFIIPEAIDYVVTLKREECK